MQNSSAFVIIDAAIPAAATARVSKAWLWWQDYSRTAASMDRW